MPNRTGQGEKQDAAAASEAAAASGRGGALAVVVDAEVTSYLMMGALSPGLKRHSVSLFEGRSMEDAVNNSLQGRFA